MIQVKTSGLSGGISAREVTAKHRMRLAALLSATAMVWSASRAHASTYTWDPGTTPATPSGGAGNWDLTSTDTFWSNGTSDVAWTDTGGVTDTAIFGGSAGGAVSQNSNLGAAEVIFTTPGYSITSGTNILLLKTAATTLDTSAIGSGTASLGNVDIGVSGETWNVGAAALTINGAVRDNGVSSETLTVNGSGTTEFAGGFTFSNTSSARTITLLGSENIDIPGLITDGSTNITNTFSYEGTGTLSLDDSANTYQTGTTNLGGIGAASGTLVVTNDGALGNAANVLTLGLFNATPIAPMTFETTGSSTLAIAHNIAINGTTADPVTIAGSEPLNVTGSVSFDTNKNINQVLNVNVATTFGGNVFLSNNSSGRTSTIAGSGSLSITGVIANSSTAGATASNLVYDGTGTLALSNSGNTFSGNILVENGTLAAANDGSLGTTNTLSIGPTSGAAVGTPTFAGIGNSLVTIAHPVIIDTTTADFATFGGSTPLDFSNTITINGASTTSETIDANNTGGTTLAGTVYLSNAGSPSVRTDTFGGSGNLNITGVVADSSIADTGSGIVYNGTGTLTLGNVNTYTGNTTLTAGTIAVGNNTALGPTGTLTFGNNTSGTATLQASGGAVNLGNSTILNSANGSSLDVIGGSNSLTLSGAVSGAQSFVALNVNNTGGTTFSGPVYLSNSTLSSRTWDIGGSGNLLVSGVISDANGATGSNPGTLVYQGTGTTTLSGVNTYTGGTNANGGTLVVAPTSTANAVALPDGPVSIGAAGKLQLADNASASSPFVNSAADISNQLMTMSSLSIASGGVLDVRNNHFYVADSGGPDDATYKSLLGYVANGANSISNGVITSSEGLSGYGVGIVDGNDGVLGTPVSAGQIEVAYTLEGDANLDGKVDITDFNIFAPNFGLPTTLGWEAGDFNYSGAVDIGDFNLFAGNFGLSDNGTAVSMPAADYAALDAFAAANGLSLTSVPEPASLSLLALGSVGILARRRRVSGGKKL